MEGRVVTMRILLYRLDQDLACELRDVLIAIHIVAAIEDQTDTSVLNWEQFDLVFCSPAKESLLNLLTATQQERPRLRLIVTSRLPDIQEWLDAIEQGATDYCAAPFEAAQIRWLLQNHFPDGNLIAA